MAGSLLQCKAVPAFPDSSWNMLPSCMRAHFICQVMQPCLCRRWSFMYQSWWNKWWFPITWSFWQKSTLIKSILKITLNINLNLFKESLIARHALCNFSLSACCSPEACSPNTVTCSTFCVWQKYPEVHKKVVMLSKCNLLSRSCHAFSKEHS